MQMYKITGKNGRCCNGGTGQWHLPTETGPGDWMPEIEGDLLPCENGYHLCRPQDLVQWFGEAIDEAEYKGDVVEDDNKVVVRKARLICRCENWNERTARLFAADCAEHVIHIFEREYPGDKRPRQAIQATRDFANSKITAAAWDAAWDAARAATGDAAWAAARAAAAAAGDAAWAAVGDAAWDAARDAEREWQTAKLMEILQGI